MKCRECGAELPDDAKFCRECGAKVFVLDNGVQFCRECGRKLEPDAKFCPGCGKPVEHIPLPECENKGSDRTKETIEVRAESEEDKPFWERQINQQEGCKDKETKREKEPLPPPLPDYQMGTSKTKSGGQMSPEIKDEPNKLIEFIKKISKKAYRKFMEFWMPLSRYGKVMTSLLAVLTVLSLVGFFAGHIFAGVLAIIQIILVAVSWLMHVERVKEPKPNMQRYLLIAALVLLLPYFLSFNTGKSVNPEEMVSTVPKETESTVATDAVKQDTKVTMPPETHAPIVETTVPVLVDNQPEMYYGTWAFNALEKKGKVVTNKELIQNGDKYLDSYRIVFRADGSGTIYEQSGTTDFNWKINPYGINAKIFTGSISGDTLLMSYPNKKMYLAKQSDSQGVPVIYREKKESSADVNSAENVSETQKVTTETTS